MTEEDDMANVPSEWPVTVRSTIEPERDIEVGEAEWTDLQRQGLLLDGYTGTEYDGPAPRAAKSQRTAEKGESA